MVPLTLTLMQLCEYIVMQLYETYQNTKLGVLLCRSPDSTCGDEDQKMRRGDVWQEPPKAHQLGLVVDGYENRSSPPASATGDSSWLPKNRSFCSSAS